MARLKTLTVNGVTYKVAPPAPVVNVTLLASAWVGSGNRYSQVVTIDGVTEKSKVNLTPSVEQITIFYDKNITFTTENDNGVVTIYVIGQKPENDYTIPADIVEVACEGGKIYGTTVTTPMNPEKISSDLSGYATMKWVAETYQPKGDYVVGSAKVPVFDLAALGIMALPVPEGTTSFRPNVMKITEITSALDNGAVAFVVPVEIGDATINATLVCTAVAANGAYQCNLIVNLGSPVVVEVVIQNGDIEFTTTPLLTYVGVPGYVETYISEALEGEY